VSPYGLGLVILCFREAAFFDYQIVHGLPRALLLSLTLTPLSVVLEVRKCLQCWRLWGSDVGDFGTLFGGWGFDLYRACVSRGMRASLSTCRVLTSDGPKSGSGRWCTVGRTAKRATWPEWIYSQRVHFEPKMRGEVRLFGFYSKEETKKQGPVSLGYPISVFNKNSTIK